jgi:hypothetical protein
MKVVVVSDIIHIFYRRERYHRFIGYLGATSILRCTENDFYFLLGHKIHKD